MLTFFCNGSRLPHREERLRECLRGVVPSCGKRNRRFAVIQRLVMPPRNGVKAVVLTRLFFLSCLFRVGAETTLHGKTASTFTFPLRLPTEASLGQPSRVSLCPRYSSTSFPLRYFLHDDKELYPSRRSGTDLIDGISKGRK